jgi:hypothetical protein
MAAIGRRPTAGFGQLRSPGYTKLPPGSRHSGDPTFTLVSNPESLREAAESVGGTRDVNEGGGVERAGAGTATKTQPTVRDAFNNRARHSGPCCEAKRYNQNFSGASVNASGF